MKIKTITISNIRGIRELTLNLNAKNVTVWGPNGTGKSGVIDAIDFLLTGNITRLVGKGTKGITLKQHGVHIDADVKDSYVEAEIILSKKNIEATLIRRMDNPKILDVSGCTVEDIQDVLDLAERGQHVLSRREILNYITAEPNNRATQIQNLLNISIVEKTRKSLVTVSNSFTKELKSSEAVLDQSKVTVKETIQIDHFEESRILKFINDQRTILRGDTFDELPYVHLKSGLSRPANLNKKSVNYDQVDNDIATLLEFEEDTGNTVEDLINLVKEIVVDQEIVRKIKRSQLYSIGYKILEEDEINECPLCEDEWNNNELMSEIVQRLGKIKVVVQKENTVKTYSSQLHSKLTKKIIAGKRLITISEGINKIALAVNKLKKWVSGASELVEILADPMGQMDMLLGKSDAFKSEGNLSSIYGEIKLIGKVIMETYPKATPEQIAWDKLIVLEENLKNYETSKIRYQKLLLKSKKADALAGKWTTARDKILEQLYRDIEDRFTNLYRGLHGSDEAGFTASLIPDNAALGFEVDFHGRGKHAPHALHSEGHQDSMGLCLFLALAEYLAEDIIEIVLLDDVVMSVDAEHRRSLCGVLKKAFPNKQFIITTHDQTWANQLKTEGVVNSKSSIQFYNWSIDSGPHVNAQDGMWEAIDEHLEENDVPGAAAKLRRGAEDFFESVCDALEAPVIYRQNRRWELGFFMPPAFSKLKELLKKAKVAANSWGDTGKLQEIKELETIANQVFTRTQVEQWGVNSSVHYNAWANFTVQDFIPIKEAFYDLMNIYLCTNCGSMMRVVKNGLNVEALKCRCSKKSFNLVEK